MQHTWHQPTLVQHTWHQPTRGSLVSAADYAAIIDGLDRKMSPDYLKRTLIADLAGLGFPEEEIALVEVCHTSHTHTRTVHIRSRCRPTHG